MKKNSCSSTLLIIGLLINLILSLILVTPAKAQDPVTTLSIVSPLVDVCAGSELTVMVRVSDVVDLYGFDILMNYDPNVIEVIELKDTSWLPDPKSNVRSEFDNSIGYLRHATFRITGTGVSGTGDILEIRLKVKSPGTVQFSFITEGTYRTKLSDSDSASIAYVIGDTGSTVNHACQLHFADSSHIVCDVTPLQVRVEDIFDLYAYDMTISYDPAIIRVDDVNFDPSFINLTLLPFIDYSTPGLIHVMGSKTNPAPPATGSGGLIFIYAYPLISDRDSGLTISSTSEFTNRYGDILPVTIDNVPVWTYPCDPNAVDLMSFDVLRKKVKAILTWETASELNNVGFNLYRSGYVDGTLKKVNKGLIPAQAVGTTMGAFYEYIDKPLKPWKTYYYWLESVDIYGETSLTGPIEAVPPKKR